MKLPDFNHFEPVLELRRQMAAVKTGNFELFDPEKHLTGQERSRLENQGINVRLNDIRVLPDSTLAIKNGRVLVFQKDAPMEKQARQHFHLALCPVLESAPEQSLVATTCLSSPFPVLDDKNRRSLSVCPECLSLLGYKGFSLTRNRRIRYSEQLMRHFDLASFFKLYPLYPVRYMSLQPTHEQSPSEHTVQDSPLPESPVRLSRRQRRQR